MKQFFIKFGFCHNSLSLVVEKPQSYLCGFDFAVKTAILVGVFITDTKNVSALMDTHTGLSDKSWFCEMDSVRAEKSKEGGMSLPPSYHFIALIGQKNIAHP